MALPAQGARTATWTGLNDLELDKIAPLDGGPIKTKFQRELPMFALLGFTDFTFFSFPTDRHASGAAIYGRDWQISYGYGVHTLNVMCSCMQRVCAVMMTIHAFPCGAGFCEEPASVTVISSMCMSKAACDVDCTAPACIICAS